MLNDSDLAKVQSITMDIINPVTLWFNEGASADAFSMELRTTAAQMSGVSMDKIRLETWNSGIFPDRPGFSLGPGDHRNIHYFAAPDGRELDPFLEAILWVSGAKDSPSLVSSSSLSAINHESQLMILMASECPHCPEVVRNALKIAVVQPLVSLLIIDALHFSDIAERYKVKATPTIVINDGYTAVGQVSTAVMIKGLTQNRQEEFTTILDSMIKAGRAEDAAALICRENMPEAIIPIYMAKEFSTRIGALVAMEEALAINPHCFDPIVGTLTGFLSDNEASLRGDTAELLGKIKNKSAIPILEKIAAEDPDPDVRDAALDALEELRED